MGYLWEIVKIKMNEQIIKEVFDILTQRKKSSEKKSYTSHLIKNPELLAKKIGEESSELIIDFIKNNKEGAIKESADLIYHVLVIWVSLGINPEEIWKELSSRKLISGIEEKKNRGVKWIIYMIKTIYLPKY